MSIDLIALGAELEMSPILDVFGMPLLEEIVASERAKLANIRDLSARGELDFPGPKEYPQDLLNSIAPKVNLFYDVWKMELPSVYSRDNLLAGYYSDQGYILVPSVISRPELVQTLIHEYAHHVQAKSGLRIGDFDKKEPIIYTGNTITLYPSDFNEDQLSIFKEGLARAAERHICKTYADAENDLAYLARVVEWTYGELKSVYVQVCNQTGLSPKPGLIDLDTCRDYDETECRRTHFKRPTDHAIGNAYFCLAEARNPRFSYRGIIKRVYDAIKIKKQD